MLPSTLHRKKPEMGDLSIMQMLGTQQTMQQNPFSIDGKQKYEIPFIVPLILPYVSKIVSCN